MFLLRTDTWYFSVSCQEKKASDILVDHTLERACHVWRGCIYIFSQQIADDCGIGFFFRSLLTMVTTDNAVWHGLTFATLLIIVYHGFIDRNTTKNFRLFSHEFLSLLQTQANCWNHMISSTWNYSCWFMNGEWTELLLLFLVNWPADILTTKIKFALNNFL